MTRNGNIPTEYNSWQAMRRRCYDRNHTRYSEWGGRGIVVCDRWRNSFPAFLEDMGKKPSRQHSIERRDNDEPYHRDNCFWATPKQQARNTRRNRILEFDGRSKSLIEWSEETGINRTTITQRLDSCGWSVEKALTKGAKLDI